MCRSMVGEAAEITWQLDNVVFDDGATATGYFVFHSDTNSVRHWTIRVEGGSGAFAPFTYNPANSYISFTTDQYVRINGITERLLQFLTATTLKTVEEPAVFSPGSSEVLSEARRSIVSGSLNGSPGAAQLFAVLLGGNEVSEAGDANAGDPDGSGGATVLIRDTTLCYAFLVTGLERPTLAHIHEGAAGINGPLVVIFKLPETGNPGATSGCVLDVDATLLNNIRQNPAGFYVNVHSVAYPGGAVRGQLSR